VPDAATLRGAPQFALWDAEMNPVRNAVRKIAHPASFGALRPNRRAVLHPMRSARHAIGRISP
jgi:hypothetical protein